MANGHGQRLFPALCRCVNLRDSKRERIDTPDGDFLDLDWVLTGARRLANPKVILDTPASSGHVGFVDFNRRGQYWSERRAAAFVADVGRAEPPIRRRRATDGPFAR